MTDWSTQTQTFHGDSKSWLGSAMHVDAGQPAELDLALFDVVTTFPNGFLPSGIVLARRTSDNVLGPYDPGAKTNEVQSIIATGGTVGDFTLAFYGETTAAIAWNATAAAVRDALLLLPNINPADIVVAGGPLPETAVTVTFAGQYAGQNVPLLVVTDNITNGTATVTTPTPGATTGQATGGAGLDVAVGHLLAPVSTRDHFMVQRVAGPATCALFTRGRVREALLPTNHGLDAAAKSALRFIEYV